MNKNNTIYGLDNKTVEKNRNKYGTNEINKEKKDGFFKLLIESFGDPIIRILLIALGIKLVFLMKNFDWFETVGIVIAIFLASFISTLSEYGSEKAFAKLQEESSKTKCKVKRNGKIEEITIDEVVYGDIVLLETGDKIPADGILIKGELNIDESSLNGESKEVHKKAIEGYSKESKENVVYRGTTVYSGLAIMQVNKVGNNTFYGKLALELQEKQPDSPLKIRLRDLAKTISYFGYGGAILVVFSYLFSTIVIANNFELNKIIDMVQNFPLISGHILYALTLAVTIIVVSVPEGLPMMITLVLSSNMKRMLKNNVLVRKLVGIETAGSLNILFTDKTGTLTKGKLDVVGFVTSELKSYKKIEELKSPILQKIFITSILGNNDSFIDDKGNIVGGNLTDRSLLKYVKDYKLNIDKIKKFPFNSTKKYSMTLINDNKKIYLVKGAPEILLKDCLYMYDDRGKKRTFSTKNKIKNILDLSTKQGMRVILLATSEFENFTNRLTFIGLLFIKDEVREEAIEGIKRVSDAHIQTVMITGDNKETALAIAKEINLINSNKDIILTSDELQRKTDQEIMKLLPNLKVVARSLPQDKSRLVRISQEMGLVVGMTGDGVNDAPALKKADVGFAMGSGTEVSKEASDIIILDDNFNSIAKSILFGRTIFKSIRKFIIFQLTVNVCAVSLSIIGPFIGVETPVTVIQMLWINMVMDTFAGLAFAFEPPLPEYMKEKPKKKNEQIINNYMKGEIFFTGLYSSLLCVLFLKVPFIKNLFRYDNNYKYLMTAFFALFIFMGIFNCFNARTHRLNLFAHLRKNIVFVLIILFITIVQIILIYYGGDLFRTAGLTINEFIIMLLIAFSVVPVDWLRKIFLRTKGEIGGV